MTRSSIVAACLWLCAACGNGGNEVVTPPADAGVIAHIPGTPGGLPVSAEAFDDTIVHRYELTIAPADLARMPMLAKNPATESMSVPAMVKVDGQDLGAVGVRFKGAFGTLRSCIDDSFKVTCPKMSYKVKFDEIEPNKRYKGLKKVNLHSMVADHTKMREQLGYKLFRDMGIVAPRSAHAQVIINGAIKGVYAVTEAPDGRFTRDRFGSRGDGNLYKEAWPKTADPKYYQSRLETNDELQQGHEQFITFWNELKTATTKTELATVVDRWADMDYMLRYTAVDRIISNWDGFATFYCGNTPASAVGPLANCSNHNLFWYLDEAKTRFWLVIWDLDLTWDLQTDHETVMPLWTETPADCTRRFPMGTNYLAAPGCDPVFRGMQGAGAAAYRRALGRLADEVFDVAKLQADVDRRAALLTEVVKTDPTLTLAGWQGRVQALRSDVVLLRQKLELMRAGQDFSPFGLRTDAVNDFEAVNAVQFAMGATMNPNPASSAVRMINQMAPLAGASDARVEFVYRTDKVTSSTWLNHRIVFKKGPVDLNAFKRVRLRMKTDKPRNVRIELDGQKYKTSRHLGWNNLPVTPQGVEVTLDLDKMDYATYVTMPPGDNPADVRSAVTALMFTVDAKGLNAMGFFPDGVTDPGFLQIDDVEFLAN